MAVKQSRKKQVRKTSVKRASNKSRRSAIKTSIKAFNLAVENEDKELALKNLNRSIKLLDRSLNKGVHNKNYANNKKALLYAAYNALDS